MGTIYGNTQALSGKTRLVYLAHTCYNSQGYNDGTITWTTLSNHLCHGFITFDYKKRARKALAAYQMGIKSITKYISAFCKHLVCCLDVQE